MDLASPPPPALSCSAGLLGDAAGCRAQRLASAAGTTHARTTPDAATSPAAVSPARQTSCLIGAPDALGRIRPHGQPFNPSTTSLTQTCLEARLLQLFLDRGEIHRPGLPANLCSNNFPGEQLELNEHNGGRDGRARGTSFSARGILAQRRSCAPCTSPATSAPRAPGLATRLCGPSSRQP